MNAKEKLAKLKEIIFAEQEETIFNTKKCSVIRNEDAESEMMKALDSSNLIGTAAEAISKHFKGKYNNSISLEDKVDSYIDWYFNNMVKDKYTDIGEFHKPNDMRNFIEKIAVWYELRYPDYEINRLMPGSGQEYTVASDEMFNKNPYINELLDEDSDIRALDWDLFYNTKAFINSLPNDEKYLFDKPLYFSSVYVDPDHSFAHLHLTKNGIVKESEGIENYTKGIVKDKGLLGMHVEKVDSLLKEKGICLPNNNELEKTIKKAENWKCQKEGMLDCVMYRLIERGGTRIGSRRAFLFAKEFNRNIDVPMMYGVDLSDPGLALFVNEYIKAGGSKDLVCYIGYGLRTSKYEKLDTISVQDLIIRFHNYSYNEYTEEETILHQRLADAIVNYIDQDELSKIQEKLKKEEIESLRLKRKLDKSKI